MKSIALIFVTIYSWCFIHSPLYATTLIIQPVEEIIAHSELIVEANVVRIE